MKIVSATLCALLLAGCVTTSAITASNFAQIQTGMSESSVYQLLGEPTEVLGGGFGPISGSNAIWKSGKTVIMIQFVNGTVQGKQYNSY
jgi:hypothetical protein